jgi:ferric-dicitrate binding protein FerR (iron transport regulator)
MDTNTFRELIDRYISGMLQEGDKAILRKLLDDPRYAQELERIMDEQLAARAAGEYDYPEVVARIQQGVAEKINEENEQTRVRRLPVWVRIAAAVLILAGGSVLVKTLIQQKPLHLRPLTRQTTARPVAPGSNKAILTLADGSRITLDSTGNQVIQQGNATIRQQQGHLQYTTTGTAENLSFNILSTPAGGQYQLSLPDGSRVWLNAASSLRFPTAFNNRERNVILTGEAYFEIAQNVNSPFKVTANDVTIEILGTHFNIMAYADEHQLTTTLLQGAVKVHGSGKAVLLRPGQQAQFDHHSRELEVSAADTESAVAWKNGYFSFSNENIQSAMRKIARWYNVDIEYRGDVTHKALWGTVSRFENINEVLSTLELTGTMHFSMEGRKVIVTP